MGRKELVILKYGIHTAAVLGMDGASLDLQVGRKGSW